jgi:CheY-like chemotaxis protein
VQCVVNILTNSAKYTDPSGEIRVQVREEAPSAVVTISDNGMGIAKELLPRIFELFVQSERALDRSQGGLGIGLSVVKRLVEMHGGSVTAHSAGPGRVATFEIRLPLVSAPSATAAEQPRKKIPSRRVLVVDDNSDAADSLALVLKLSGHQTRSAYTPEEALEHTTEFKPDVVLLDIGLPRISGYELAQRIRAGDKVVQLVAITGYGQREDIQRAHTSGFDAHVIKPVDFPTLERILAAPRRRTRSEDWDAAE